MDRLIERVLVAARWLLAPLYLGLAALLLLFWFQFFRELVETAIAIVQSSSVHLTIAALTMVDLVLVASLIVMVMLSGYENFIAKIDADISARFSWLAKLDAGSIKVKVAVTIVVIATIDLLKAFLEVEDIANDKLLWRVVVVLTFVASAIALAALDRLTQAQHES